MKVQPISNHNNISAKALVLAKEPAYGAIVHPEIKNALEANQFINNLSQINNVVASFVIGSKDKAHHLRLDIFDKITNEIAHTMLFSSRIYNINGAKTDLSPTEFIKHVEMPEKVIKRNWLDRLLKRPAKEEYIQSEYFNYSLLHENDKLPIKNLDSSVNEDLNNAEKQMRETAKAQLLQQLG